MTAISETTGKKPRGPGKKFAKGVSGNPSGRPARTQEELDLIAACKDKTPAALNVIVDIMQNGGNERNRLAAAESIINRAYGKPIQQNEITGANGAPFVVQIVKFNHADDPASE